MVTEYKLSYTASDIDRKLSIIDDKLDANKLPEAINTALSQAKGSGEFDGEDGYSPSVHVTRNNANKCVIISTDNADGSTTATIYDGKDGESGVYTLADGETIENAPEWAKVVIDPNGTPDGDIDTSLTADTMEYHPVLVSFDHMDAMAQFNGIGSPPRIIEKDGGFSYSVISVTKGEMYKIDGVHYWESACYILTDANGNTTRYDGALDNNGETVIQQEFTIQAGECYLYVNSMGPFVSLQKKVVKLSGYYGPLFGKKIVYDGDSICAPWNGDEGNGGAYPKLIADYTGCTYDNQAVGGGRFTTCPAGENFHSIVDNLSNLPTDADLYCFEGGINDYSAAVTLGDIDYSNFTGELDATTLCGALETIFRYCLNNFVGKPVCLIITHKCQESAYKTNGAGNTFAQFREKMIAVCEKYSIPYYDAFGRSGLNGWNASQKARYFINADGTHPNVKGYKRYYMPQLINLFECILPIGIAGEIESEAGEHYINILDTVGYTENVRISSSGELKEYADRDATGKIPVSYGDIVYLKNVTMPNSSNDYENKIAYWNSDGSLLTQYDLTTEAEPTAIYNDDGNLIQFTVSVNCSHIQLGALNIDANSIITVNQPID